MEATSMPMDRWMDKDVVRTDNGILLSHKNETKSLTETQMQLEIIILSEVSQKEEDKYHMLSLIYGI